MPLLDRADVPEHIRALTSPEVLAVEADLVTRLIARAEQPAHVPRSPTLDPTQGPTQGPTVWISRSRRPSPPLAGSAQLLVVEGAAGAGKTTTLAAARRRCWPSSGTGWSW